MSEFRASRDGIERTIQRVVAVILLLHAVTTAWWAAHHDATPVAGTLLVAGCCILVVLGALGWTTRLRQIHAVVALALLPVALVVNDLVDADGIAIQSGPAYVFLLVVAVLTAVLLPLRDFALVAICIAAIYAAGRAWHGGADHLMTGLDEAIVELSTIGAAALAIGSYRRSGRRADESAERRFSLQALQATTAARDVVLAERRRVIHDDVIAALVTIRSGRSTEVGRAASRRALDAIAGFHEVQSQPDTSWVRDGDLTIEVEAEVHRHEGSTERPAHVAAALAGAIREAIRNADRHSGVQVVRLHVEMIGDGVTVTVRDEGSGFDTSAPGGFGLRESIRARVEMVGGTVDIDSAPGRGTTVTLAWEPGGDTPSVPPDDLAILQPDLGDLRRFSVSVTSIAAIGPLWLLARHGTESPPVSILLALAVLAMTFGVALFVARRRLGPLHVAAIAGIWGAALALGLALAPDGALLAFDSWMVQVVGVIFFTISFFVPARALVAVAAVQTAVLCMTIAGDPQVDPSEAIGPLLLAPVSAATLGAVAAGFRRAGREALRQEAAAARETIEHAHDVARRTAVADLELVVRQDLERFLRDVSDGTLDATDPRVQDQAHVLAVHTRDELYLPGVLDVALHRLLATARSAGAKVTIHPSPVLPETHRTARLLRSAIDPANLVEATLTLPDRTDDRARLVLVPPLDDHRTAQLLDHLDDMSPKVEVLEGATIITATIGRMSSPYGRSDHA